MKDWHQGHLLGTRVLRLQSLPHDRVSQYTLCWNLKLLHSPVHVFPIIFDRRFIRL